MRPITVTVTGTGSSAAIPTDYYTNPFNIGFAVVISGAVDYTVEHTFDNIQDPTATITWFPHPTVFNEAANQDGNYAFPVTAVRLTNNVGTGAGATSTLTLIQAGF
jgi:hypothetical protein